MHDYGNEREIAVQYVIENGWSARHGENEAVSKYFSLYQNVMLCIPLRENAVVVMCFFHTGRLRTQSGH